MQHYDSGRTYRILICDLISLKSGPDGRPDCSELRRHIEAEGCCFHEDAAMSPADVVAKGIHFFYKPDLNAEDEFLAEAGGGLYDAVIAAATVVPADAIFPEGGVRIGAGTGNMRSLSWCGKPGGVDGTAPLMNTPGINSRATAQMVMKAILRFVPDLPFDDLHTQVLAGEFDTGRDLRHFATETLEGKRIAVLGYGNIGREVARLASAFGMRPVIYARAAHRRWIESEGFDYAETPIEAARGADILSIHLGLGPLDSQTQRPANAGLVGDAMLKALGSGALLINFDRAELVDAVALSRALDEGSVRFAAIDADVFSDVETGVVTGPLAPYLALAQRHPGRLLLLPHAVADTDHPARVRGAKQAVDQILEAIRFRRLANVKDAVPPGYSTVSRRPVVGIGSVTAASLSTLETQDIARLAALAGELGASWEKIGKAADAPEREALCRMLGDSLVLAGNQYASLIRKRGLHGPFSGQVVSDQ